MKRTNSSTQTHNKMRNAQRARTKNNKKCIPQHVPYYYVHIIACNEHNCVSKKSTSKPVVTRETVRMRKCESTTRGTEARSDESRKHESEKIKRRKRGKKTIPKFAIHHGFRQRCNYGTIKRYRICLP